MSKIDITNTIERLEVFEERMGVNLDSMSAFYINEEYNDNDDKIEILGELIAKSGGEIEESIELVLAIYDEQGRVIGKDTSWIDKDDFFGLETFNLSTYIPKKSKISKLRLYPKKS